MLIHILYNFKEGPYGGGNQFLKALRKEFKNIGVYADHACDADVCLFNGYPFSNFDLVTRLHETWLKYPEKVYIFRLDGPTVSIRGSDKHYDFLLKNICDLYIDGIVFQSKWCKRSNKRLTGIYSNYEAIIVNAPDRAIFNSTGKFPFENNRKIRLIATSWSNNLRKGFEAYRYLDEHLDWNRYEMTFVGNSPFVFRNIRMVSPQTSLELAKTLRQHDIYITASTNDPCSNSLIEALSCGLPAVALDDGGHPELIGKGGILFERKEEIPQRIETVVREYNSYQINIPILDIAMSARKYIDFGSEISKSIARNNKLKGKDATLINAGYRKLKIYFLWYEFILKIKRTIKRYV